MKLLQSSYCEQAGDCPPENMKRGRLIRWRAILCPEKATFPDRARLGCFDIALRDIWRVE
jgi:hypothetical protein